VERGTTPDPLRPARGALRLGFEFKRTAAPAITPSIHAALEGDTGTENQMTAATYRLDGTETTVPGPLGWDTRAKAVRRDGALVINVTRTIDGPDGKLRFEITDVYRESNGVLTLERTQGSRTRKMTYNRGRP